MPDEIAWMSARELAEAIRTRALSPVEVVDAVLARIDEVNPPLNAIVTRCDDAARSSAREAEAAVMRGDDLGPLHGVPFTVKDLEQTAALDVLKDLQPVSYRLNAQPDESTLGFIAEDVPELVASVDRETVNPMEIVAVLTRALQAQQQMIENQRQEAIHLEGRIFDLEQALLGEEGGSQ